MVTVNADCTPTDEAMLSIDEDIRLIVDIIFDNKDALYDVLDNKDRNDLLCSIENIRKESQRMHYWSKFVDWNRAE